MLSVMGLSGRLTGAHLGTTRRCGIVCKGPVSCAVLTMPYRVVRLCRTTWRRRSGEGVTCNQGLLPGVIQGLLFQSAEGFSVQPQIGAAPGFSCVHNYTYRYAAAALKYSCDRLEMVADGREMWCSFATYTMMFA